MSLTPAQIRAALTPLVRRLIGWNVAGFDAAGPDLGQISVRAPDGQTLTVTLPVTVPQLFPITPFVADVQGKLRTVLRPFEGEFGRGFDDAGRSTLAVGSRGYSANDGWV